MRGIQVQVDDEPSEHGDEAVQEPNEGDTAANADALASDLPNYYLINKVKAKLDSLPHMKIDLK